VQTRHRALCGHGTWLIRFFEPLDGLAVGQLVDPVGLMRQSTGPAISVRRGYGLSSSAMMAVAGGQHTQVWQPPAYIATSALLRHGFQELDLVVGALSSPSPLRSATSRALRQSVM
jgi:hypothetical protein